jgi:hypothetical protein
MILIDVACPTSRLDSFRYWPEKIRDSFRYWREKIRDSFRYWREKIHDRCRMFCAVLKCLGMIWAGQLRCTSCSGSNAGVGGRT